MRSILVIGLLLCLGCQNTEDWRKNLPPIPSQLDTLYDAENILKIRKIFRSGISYHYRAQYLDQKGQVISDNTVSIIPTGQRWNLDPDQQDAIVELLGYTDEEKARILANPINQTLDLGSRWTSEMQEGVIENTKRIWMHPIRVNQYIFTQVAPFPEIQLPPKVGKTWESQISGLGGWGDWDGTTIRSVYEITGKAKIQLPFGKVDCWVIEASSTFKLGQSQVSFYFHEDLGFVKMDYFNYLGQRLLLDMQIVTPM